MVGSIVEASVQSVLMTIGGDKNITALDAGNGVPIFAIAICGMCDQRGFAVATGTYTPVAGLISMEFIGMIICGVTGVTTTVACFIACGCKSMELNFCIQTATLADMPVVATIESAFLGEFMTAILCETAGITRSKTTAGEGVLVMGNSASAISTARPMI